MNEEEIERINMKEPQPPYDSPPRDLLKRVEKTKLEVFHLLMVDEHFNDFIEMVDKTSQGELIESLFGSEEAYIDTPGNYRIEKNDYGGGPVEHYIDNCGSGGGQPDQVLAMYAWYIGNFYKVNAWMTQEETKKRTD